MWARGRRGGGEVSRLREGLGAGEGKGSEQGGGGEQASPGSCVGGFPLLRGQRGAPSLVAPTPTLSLLDRVSRCKPQAPRGFSSVTGSGQVCPVLPGGPAGCLSPAFPRSQPAATPPPPQQQGSRAQGAAPSQVPPKPHGSHAGRPQLDLSHLGTGWGSRRCQRPDRGPRRAAWFSLRQDPRNRGCHSGGRPGGQTGLGVTPGGGGDPAATPRCLLGHRQLQGGPGVPWCPARGGGQCFATDGEAVVTEGSPQLPGSGLATFFLSGDGL